MCAGGRLGWSVAQQGAASMTGGLVREYSHVVLPSVPPLATLILTLLSILVGNIDLIIVIYFCISRVKKKE